MREKKSNRNQATFRDELTEDKYEIKFFSIKSFLARNYPEILDEFEEEEVEERGNVVYG